jgi:hypothetical protein
MFEITTAPPETRRLSRRCVYSEKTAPSYPSRKKPSIQLKLSWKSRFSCRAFPFLVRRLEVGLKGRTNGRFKIAV